MTAAQKEKVRAYFEKCPDRDRVWLIKEYNEHWMPALGKEVLKLSSFAQYFDDDDGLMGFFYAYGNFDLRIDPWKHDYVVIGERSIRGYKLQDLCREILRGEDRFLEAIIEGRVWSPVPHGLKEALASKGKTTSKSAKAPARKSKPKTTPKKRAKA
jgi:hypothetical protein